MFGVGQGGGQGVEPVVAGGVVDGGLVAVPGDGGFGAVVDAGGDGDQPGDVLTDDLRDAGVDLGAGLVVAPAEAVADPGEVGFDLAEGTFAGLGDRGGFLAGPDVGHPQLVVGSGGGVGDRQRAQQPAPAGAPVGGQVLLALGDIVEYGQGVESVADVGFANRWAQPVSARSGTTNRTPARSAAHRLPRCPSAESATTTGAAGSSSTSRSRAWPRQVSSAAEPLCGRKYSATPSGVAACRVRTWRATRRSAPQPLATSAESS